MSRNKLLEWGHIFKLLLVSYKFLEKCKDYKYKTMYIESFERLPFPATAYQEKVIKFCQAWMAGQSTFKLYTSGSTGQPKELLLTRQQMLASARMTGNRFDLKAGQHALVCLNVDYIAGMMMLVRAMVLGLRATVIEPKANPFAEISHQATFDYASFVPLQLQTLLLDKEAISQLNKMKVILVGGAAVSNTLAESIKKHLHAPVYSTYGMTETVSHIAIRAINQQENAGIFDVLEGVDVGVDERQCLTICAAVTNFERIQTNDLVEMLTTHSFRLLGRYDNIINSGGVKVQLEKVEKAFAEILETETLSYARSFAYGVPDERLGQRLVMVLEPNEATTEEDFMALTNDEPVLVSIREKMKKVLGKYEVPKEFYTISHFSETPTGKIDKIATIKRLNL